MGLAFSHIYAQDETGLIGIDNILPWKCVEDLKYFKDVTKYSIVIMGRNTFQSMPTLPNRISIVVTKHGVDNIDYFKQNYNNFSGSGAFTLTANSIESALELAQQIHQHINANLGDLDTDWVNEYYNIAYIIGGGEIFKATQHLVSKVYVNTLPLCITPLKGSKPVYYRNESLSNPDEWHVSFSTRAAVVELANNKVHATLQIAVYERKQK